MTHDLEQAAYPLFGWPAAIAAAAPVPPPLTLQGGFLSTAKKGAGDSKGAGVGEGKQAGSKKSKKKKKKKSKKTGESGDPSAAVAATAAGSRSGGAVQASN